MRASIIRVTTKVGEGENQKRYSAKKEINVPSTLQECLEAVGESGLVAAYVEKLEGDETAKLRQKLIAKVSPDKAVSVSDAEEVSIDD